jgi:ATP-binding cassette, subfamily C, bacterial CydCD
VTLGGATGPAAHDLADYAADEVRTVIGGCPQDAHIFDTSVRDNLRLARPGAGDDELARAPARASPARDDDTAWRRQQTAAMAAEVG